jgi:alpha-amylase/alpha-mannosidase (GH57 family)
VTHWAQLLHFYQPPTQTHEILVRVANESYRPLLRVLAKHPNARLAVNVQGVLTQLLQEHGQGDIVESLMRLADRGIIEFVGSGKYHPILPLVPAERRASSIAQNHETNASAYGEDWKPRGFFPPEMCFGPQITPEIAAAGHDWLIMSGVGCPGPWPIDRVHRVKAGEGSLAVLFRDDVRSNKISFRRTSPEEFIHDLQEVGGGNDSYVVTAMDAETFGHHIAGWENEFLDETLGLLTHQGRRGAHRVQMAFPSTVVDQFPAGEVIQPLPSSWSTSEQDIESGDPYPLWKSPGNHLHAMQWEYVDHCMYLEGVARQYAREKEAATHAAIASERLEPALHSCQFWWASRRPMWDFTMVHRGFMLLSEVELNAAHAIALGDAPEEVKQESRWRVAAANELRFAIENALVGSARP